MTTPINELQKRIEDALKKRFEPTEAPSGEQAVGVFDWTILIQPIMDVILSILNGCLNKNQNSTEAVTANVMRDDPLTHWVVRWSVGRSSEIKRVHREAATQTILDVMTNRKPEEVSALVAEVNDRTPPWMDW